MKSTVGYPMMSRAAFFFIFLLFSCPAGSAAPAGKQDIASEDGAGQRHSVYSSSQVDLNQDWMAGVQEDIRHREYFFHYGPADSDESGKDIWQAPNRKQNLRIYVNEKGIEVMERQGKGRHLLGLATVALGRGNRLSPLESGTISAHENRLEIRRGSLTEWYINSEAGIEQGFTLAEKPLGTGKLTITLDCGLQPIVLDDTHLLFSSHDTHPIAYDNLIVTDGKGKRIPAGFTLLADNRFGIEIDDREASYPLTIDPIITSTYDLMVPGPQDQEGFGIETAGVGDVNGDGYADIIVGAPRYDNGENLEGAVFLYLGSSSGLIPNSTYHWEGNIESLRFGTTLSGAGDVNGDGKDDFIVGSGEKDIYNMSLGNVIIYYGDSNPSDGLTHSSSITGSSTGDRFGTTVSGAGDVNGDGYADVIIGAPGYDAGKGQAFVFYGSAMGVDMLYPDSFAYQSTTGQPLPSYDFGYTVAGAGDVNADGYADVLVSTNRDDANTPNAVYIYYGSINGISTDPQHSEITIAPQNDSSFGSSMTAAGDLNGDGYGDIAIGAPVYTADGLESQGAIFIHFGSSSGLSSIIPSVAFKSNAVRAFLGHSLSGAGDLNGDGYSDLVAGANGYESLNGAVYVYYGSSAANGVNFITKISLHMNIWFGYSVAIAGDVNGDGYDDLAVGAPLLDINLNNNGGIFVFHGSATPIDNTPDFFLESNQEGAFFGTAVSGAGDFNGDGYDDIIIGAPGFDNGQGSSGMAFLYYGPPGGLLWPFPLQLGGDVAGRYFGKAVSGAGDVNGDGYGDVIIGDPNGTLDGKAYIYYGDSFLNFPPKSVLRELKNESFGAAVSGAGDVNGDGYADVIVADPNYNHNLGRVSIYYGTKNGISTTSATRIQESNGGVLFSLDISGGGDVNGDGYSDIFINAHNYENGETREGAIFVYHGSAHGVSATPDAVLEGNHNNAYLGEVSNAGDVNGDGFDDIIVGASGIGRGYLYLGSTNGLANSLPIILQGSDASFGSSVSGAGDVNNDGFDDILVGTQSNSATLFFGKPHGVDTGSPVIFQSPRNNSFFGDVLSGAGDINGDGFADIIIGAETYDHGQINEGAAFLYLGNSNGRPIRTTFLRADGSHPVASRGASYSNHGMGIRMDLFSPRGKEKIRIEALVCPEIQPPPGVFNVCDTYISPWQDATANYIFQLAGLSPRLYSVRTRIAYAPYAAVTQGIYQPAHLCAGNFPCLSSRHGPWRYLAADPSKSVIRIGFPQSPRAFPWPVFLPAIISGGK